ncbi:hypothetical protein J2X36_004645 [Methylobacterium sp. BE186]|nr:hypothetical protein [Methylobacterium sp. BE186]MDR7039867.1 hypothetical protein [Methylobacterium sp. BE186]
MTEEALMLPFFQSPVGTIVFAGTIALAAMGLVVVLDACVPQ